MVALSQSELSQVSNWDVIFTGEDALLGSFNIASPLISIPAESALSFSLSASSPCDYSISLWPAGGKPASAPWVSGTCNTLVLCGGDLAKINYDYPAITQGKGMSAGLCVSLGDGLSSHECSVGPFFFSFFFKCPMTNKIIACNCKVTTFFFHNVYEFQARAYLDCRSCRWNQGGTCTYWVPRSLRAYSQAGTELFMEDSKGKRQISAATLEHYLYKIRMTKHLIPLLLDLAVNYLFTPHHSNKTAWCLIHIGNVFVSFSLRDNVIIID